MRRRTKMGKSAAEYVREAREIRSSLEEDKLWDMVAATDQYGLSEVAEILRIPEWRVKNFAQGAAYGITPRTVGKKKLRVFGWLDLARIELAQQLVNDGFSPSAVGAALSKLPGVLLRPSRPETYLLLTGGEWKCVMGHKEVKRQVSRAIGEPEGTKVPGVYLLNVTRIMAGLAAKWEPWGKEHGVSLGVEIPKEIHRRS